jgi:dolichyl-diphosphooligosaccharide--protein glycosyltransferase
LVYERYNRTSRESSVHDDYREAYAWLRENTKDDATILSWWDYGYQLSSLANRTVLVDNNTWNNTHIATVGRVFASSEEDALPILQSLGVDYIFLLFGGKSGMSGDDLDKFPWFLRIAQGVFPDDVIENDFRSNGYLKFQENSTHAVTSSLIYKLSYYGFDQVEDYNEVTTGKGLEATKGYDRSRRRVVTTKPIILNHFEEAFTSDEWIVRIFRFRSSSL